jgi:ABC-type sugar transport system ATPase subunit
VSPVAGRVTSPVSLVAVRGLRKSFGSVEVLHGIDVDIEPGERHAIVGENGAGKSTLMRVIAGALVADAGTVSVDGAPLAPGVQEARAAGIALVHQELSLVPDLSIAENVVLGRHPVRRGRIDRRAMYAHAEEALGLVGLQRDPRALVRDLSFGERQLVEIGAALRLRPRLLVLDEPTSALSPIEVRRLFDVLANYEDTTVLYVSHRIPEVYALCGRATVLRDGELVGTYDLPTTEAGELIAAMVGRQVDLLARREPLPADELGPVVLALDDVAGPRVDGVSLAVRAGEVLGIGGLVGAGRSDLLALVSGRARATSGEMRLGGEPYRPRSPYDAWRAGVGVIPEDRQDGLALELDVAMNAAAPSIRRLTPRGWLRPRRLGALAEEVVRDAQVTPPRVDLTTAALSGGNQQKLVLGKWLPERPRLLLLDEPTKGVDVEAKSEIHRRIDRLARDGVAVVLVSSDLPELLTLSDRILVMRDGRVTGALDPDSWSEAGVLGLATQDDRRERVAA